MGGGAGGMRPQMPLTLDRDVEGRGRLEAVRGP